MKTVSLDRTFPYGCGRLRGLHHSKIDELVSKLKHGDKPVALFSFLIRQYKEEQKRIADQ